MVRVIGRGVLRMMARRGKVTSGGSIPGFFKVNCRDLHARVHLLDLRKREYHRCQAGRRNYLHMMAAKPRRRLRRLGAYSLPRQDEPRLYACFLDREMASRASLSAVRRRSVSRLSHCCLPFARASSTLILPFLKYIRVGISVSPFCWVLPMSLRISSL